jgi:hypothetical protein
METTVAVCQATGFGTLVTVVPLFPPGVTVVVVSVHLPEPRLVVLHEAKAAYPLGGLPEIEVWHQEARWPAVFGRERLTVVLPDNQRLPFSRSSTGRLVVYPPSQNAITKGDGGSSNPAAAKIRSTEAPRQSVSSFDQRVTQ